MKPPHPRSHGPREQRHEGRPPQGRPPWSGTSGGAPHRPASQPDRRPPPPAHGPAAPRGAIWLYGLHPVAAALANPGRRLRRLVLTEEAAAAIAQRVPQPWPLPPETVERLRIDQLLGREAVHQGAALLADPLAPPMLATALERKGPVLVLDQVSDPRNVGAILRAAAAFGVAAVITQERNAPEETGALAKAASGALETVPLLRAVNLARTLVALRAAGLWIVGLDAGGPALSGRALAARRVALVLGGEGAGLRRLTRETCDEVAGLPMPGGMESLNVAAAREARPRPAPLDDADRPPDVAAGAAAQRAIAARLGAIPPAGFKIGATARRMQEYLGLTEPAAGFMPASGQHRSGAVLRFADLFAPGVECELAVRLAHDLPAQSCTPERAAAAVGELFAAIEVVENRYPDLALLGTPTLIADQVFHAGAVLGAPYAGWRDLDLISLAGRITVGGNERGAGKGGDLLGDPMRALAWLAGSEVAAAFGGLRAGQVVLLGSVTPPIFLDGPCAVEVAFPPLPKVQVTLH